MRLRTFRRLVSLGLVVFLLPSCSGGADNASGTALAPVNDVVWEWSMVDLDPAAMGRCAMLHRVVWFRSHWVAVGIFAPDEFSGTCDDIEFGTGVGKAAAWVSSDGLVWERVAVWDAWYPMELTAGGPGLVAVGGALDEQLDPPRPYPVVWLSADGEDWWPVDDPVRDGSVGQMFGVAATTDGLVAVGYDCADPADRDCWAGFGFWNSRPAIWTSADGTEWVRVPDDSAVFQGDSRIHGVAATPLGWVAVGRQSIALPEDMGEAMFAPESIPVAWLSENGVDWTVLDLPVESDDDCLPDTARGVATVGGQVVITGLCNAPLVFQVPVVWTTDTGTKWTISQFTGHQRPSGFPGVIAAGESGFLMVGGSTDLSVWDSPDATEWTHTSIGRAMWIGDASAHGSTVLVVGRTDYEGTPNNVRVWIGTAIPK